MVSPPSSRTWPETLSGPTDLFLSIAANLLGFPLYNWDDNIKISLRKTMYIWP
jgi:hypothetical protein